MESLNKKIEDGTVLFKTLLISIIFFGSGIFGWIFGSYLEKNPFFIKDINFSIAIMCVFAIGIIFTQISCLEMFPFFNKALETTFNKLLNIVLKTPYLRKKVLTPFERKLIRLIKKTNSKNINVLYKPSFNSLDSRLCERSLVRINYKNIVFFVSVSRNVSGNSYCSYYSQESNSSFDFDIKKEWVHLKIKSEEEKEKMEYVFINKFVELKNSYLFSVIALNEIKKRV